MIEYLNIEMHRVDVLGLELKCFGDGDTSMVMVPRIIGQTQAAIDRRTVQEKQTLWTKDSIQDAINQMPEGIFKQRIQTLFDWACKNGSLIEKTGRKVCFGIRNAAGNNMLHLNLDGTGYAPMNKRYFNNEQEQATGYCATLVKVGLLAGNTNCEDIQDGRNLLKTVADMEQERFDFLLSELEKYI